MNCIVCDNILDDCVSFSLVIRTVVVRARRTLKKVQQYADQVAHVS